MSGQYGIPEDLVALCPVEELHQGQEGEDGGEPAVRNMSLDDYDIGPSPSLTLEEGESDGVPSAR